MDELIRATLHDALDVEEPYGLRARVVAAVPMDPRRRAATTRRRAMRLQWAAGLTAIVVTAALLAGLVGFRLGIRTQPVGPVGPALKLTNPSGIAIAPDGTVYVADYLQGRILRVQSDGTLVSVAGGGLQSQGPGRKANVFGPLGLAFSPSGDLYIGESGGTRISELDRNGNLTTTLSTYGSVWGLAFNRFGTLYASLYDQVVAVIPAGRTPIDFSGVGGPPVWAAYLAFNPTDDLYVTDLAPAASAVPLTPVGAGGCRILRVQTDNSVSVVAGTGRCGFTGDGGPATKALLDNPNGIALDAAGNVYVADSNNHRIRRIDTHGVITTIAGTGIAGHKGDGGLARSAELENLAGLAIAQGRYLYFSEFRSDNAYGAVRVIDLRNGTIRTVVDSSSRVVS